jgi:hypothetical protein
MPSFSRRNLQSTQQPRPVCAWSAHAPQCGSSPSPVPRSAYTLTATATAAGELLLFGGFTGFGCATNDLYAFSTLDLSHFSTTLLQTSGEVPTPRAGHGAALIGTTTLLICGGIKSFGDQNVLNNDSLYLLNLGTSDLLIQVRHQLIIALRSSIARVDPRCGQWSRTGRSPQPKLPNHNRGRFQALRLRWSDWRDEHQ